MADEIVIPSCNMLKEPLSFSELIQSGTKFEINTNFDDGITDEIFDELNIESDDDNAENPDLSEESLVSPWSRSFDELKEKMKPIGEHMHKKIVKEGISSKGCVPINARVSIRYSAYWEGVTIPFDSSILRGSAYSFYTGRSEVIDGLEQAVKTMYPGEHSQFVISYHLLFREMGCPPRVKPCADGLFIIEVVSFTEVGDINADASLTEADRKKFSTVIDKVKQIHLKGIDFFGQEMHRNAIRAFERAVDALTMCSLRDEKEDEQHTAYLLKLYTNLAVCYIKVGLPNKTCLMCNEINRLTNGKPSCKALFQEGRALFMLGEFVRARNILKRCLIMEPQNTDISMELQKLDERYARYKKVEQEMWTNAMGVIKKIDNSAIKEGASKEASTFEKDMMQLLVSFKDNGQSSSLTLPPGLTDKELNLLSNMAKKLELMLTQSPIDERTYILRKK